MTKYFGNEVNVVIPDVVKEIDGDAFNSANIRSVHIGKKVEYISFGAFTSNCRNLESITVDFENEYYQSIDGVLYSKDGDELIKYPPAKEESVFFVPDEVREIGPWAFLKCENLIKVVLPRGVRRIESNAFGGAVNLEKIEMPDDLQSIGSGAFSDCMSLKEILQKETKTTFRL